MFDWFAIDKSPNVLVKRTEFLLYFQGLFCVVDRGLDLETVMDDSGIAEKTLDILVIITGNFRNLKELSPACAPSSTRNSNKVLS